MPRTLPNQVLHFVASVAIIVLLAAHSPAAAPQKPAPAAPQSKAQLEERVKKLETDLQIAQQQTEKAAMEKDYITRVQKQYETYYEKVLSTQTWTLGIFGLVLTALLIFAGVFSFNVFDNRAKSALDTALAQVEKKFSEQMEKELERLRQQNSSRVEALEDALTKRITEQEQDLKTRSDFQFHFVRGLAAAVNHTYDAAQARFRQALTTYVLSKPKQLIEKESGLLATRNFFAALRDADEPNYLENAKQELADKFYDDLEDELAQVALRFDWLAPLVKERNVAQKQRAAVQPKTGVGKPNEPLPASASKDDK